MKIETLRKIMAWERAFTKTGDEGLLIELFQDLIDSGDVQHMGEYYQDVAHTLIQHGICHKPVLRVVK